MIRTRLLGQKIAAKILELADTKISNKSQERKLRKIAVGGWRRLSVDRPGPIGN